MDFKLKNLYKITLEEAFELNNKNWIFTVCDGNTIVATIEKKDN